MFTLDFSRFLEEFQNISSAEFIEFRLQLAVCVWSEIWTIYMYIYIYVCVCVCVYE